MLQCHDIPSQVVGQLCFMQVPVRLEQGVMPGIRSDSWCSGIVHYVKLEPYFGGRVIPIIGYLPHMVHTVQLLTACSQAGPVAFMCNNTTVRVC
jgi:hypothetical protein